MCTMNLDRSHPWLLLPALVLGVWLPCAAWGATPPAAAPVAREGTVLLNFGNQVDIRLVVDYVAARLQKNFLYDETLTGNVAVRATREVPVDALYGVLESILEFKGFALTPSPDGFIKVVPIGVAAAKPTPFFGPGEIGSLPTNETIVTQVVMVKYADPGALVNNLQAMAGGGASAARGAAGRPAPAASGPGARIQAIPEHRLLVITDYAPNVQRMLKMIALLDAPAAVPQLQVIPLQHVRADVYAPKIQALLSARQSTDGGARRTAAIDWDPRLNALLVLALPDQINDIRTLARQFDVEMPEAERPYRIIRLKNSSAEEMLATVQQVMMSGGKENGGAPTARSAMTSATTAPKAAPTATPASLPTESATHAAAAAGSIGNTQLSLVANKHTNSLILMGPPSEQAMLASVIAELDRRRPQVMIEALVVEVSGTRQIDIGTELASLKSLSKDGVSGATSFGYSAIDFNNATSTISTLPGLTGFLIHDANFQALVHLFEQKVQGKVVSRPRALINDNESALFRSEQEQPYTQISSLSATTTTVSFQDYARAGISLQVTPHISEADYLQLDITVNLSSFTGDASSASTPPPRSTNFVQSKVTVPDNSTVLLGGLNQANRSVTARQVPILGDIPLLGYLFRRKTTNQGASTLYVFVKSRIARAEDFSDLKAMGSEASVNLLRQENLQRQKHDQVPVTQDIYESPALKPEGTHGR